MTAPIYRSTIPSLSEYCVESYLSSGLDHQLTSQQQDYLDETILQNLWTHLETNVPKGALGLQTTMADIKKGYDPQNNTKALESKVSHFFRKLAEVLTPEFEEAGVVLNNRIPCSSSEYKQLQKVLRGKWSDETLLILWSDLGGGGLRRVLNRLGAFHRRTIPESPQEIRKWLNRTKNAIFLDQIEGIHLNRLRVRVCPTVINRFHFLITLDLRRNNIRSFSCDISPCKYLKELFLSHNKIQIFAPNLSNNFKLQCIDVSMNRLNSFSANLEKCVELKCLNISFNEIVSFSSSLKDCKKLETLNLSFNKIRKFSFKLLPHEEAHVLLSRNPLLKPIIPKGFVRIKPPEIVVIPPSPRVEAPVAMTRTRAQLLPPLKPPESENSPKSKRVQNNR